MATRRRWSHVGRSALLAVLLLASTELEAQYLGFNLRGDVGLKSGTQPAPGAYLILPFFYRSDYKGVRDARGTDIAPDLDINVNFVGTPGLYVTTKTTLFGGTYGFQVIFPVSTTRLTLAQPDVPVSQGYGFTDMYVQPVNLGWRTPRADFLAGYAVFAPTGTGDHSLEMWGHELSAGSTVYFDDTKRLHAAATAFYELHGKKNDRDLRVGDLLTIEGGAGTSFFQGAANFGVAYVAQWKVTNDRGSDFPPLLPKSKSRVFGLGPDATLPLFSVGTVVGLVNFRFLWELGGRSTFEGYDFVASFTLAKLTLP